MLSSTGRMKPSTLSISVVIPAYNEQDLLPACLESLRIQTRVPDEIIIVDNNSNDKTAQIARNFGAKVVKETKQGIMPAVYTGISASRSEVIARCDADSIVPVDWLERIEKTLQDNPNAAGLTGPGRFYNTGSVRATFAQGWYMYSYFLLVGSALANWPVFGSNCAIRRSAWQAIESQLHRDRTDIHDDMEISAHLSPMQPIIFKPSLIVGISARALRIGDMQRRYKYGWNTLSAHWPAGSPWRRWRTKLKLERA